MKCLYCGTENAADAKFCEECGQPLQETDRKEKIILCPKCSAKNSPDVLFCESCGYRLKIDVSGLTGQQEPSQPRRSSGGNVRPQPDQVRGDRMQSGQVRGGRVQPDQIRGGRPQPGQVRGGRVQPGRDYDGGFQPGPGYDSYEMNQSYTRRPSRNSRKTGLIAGIAAAVVLFLAVGGFLGYRFIFRKDTDQVSTAGTENKNAVSSVSRQTEGIVTQDSQTESQTQAQTQPQTQAQTQPQTQPQTQAQTQPQTQPQTSPPVVTGDSSFYKDGTVVTKDGYIIPDSSSRYLTDADVNRLTLKGICYAKNELYAKLGRKFSSAELATYFGGQSWYTGTYEPNYDNDQMLVSRMNEYENANMQFLADAEAAQGEYQLDVN